MSSSPADNYGPLKYLSDSYPNIVLVHIPLFDDSTGPGYAHEGAVYPCGIPPAAVVLDELKEALAS